VIRPDDLAVLAFDLVNLQVKPGEGHNTATLAKKGPSLAYLIVWFPPQHILEKAYFTTDPNYKVKLPTNPLQGLLVDPDQFTSKPELLDTPPIDARIAGWSRLVFYVPDDMLPIEWTLEGLLKAIRNLEMSVPTNALPPEKKLHFLREVLAASVQRAALTASLAIPPSALQSTASGVSAELDSSMQMPEALVDPPELGAMRIFAIARSRRKVRTVGNALGLATVTGAASKNLGLLYEDDLFGKGIAPVLRRPEPMAPAVTQTALELPFRVVLSPNRFGAWFHADLPMTSQETGYTELWHTRLGVRREDGTLIDGDDPLRKLRAVWTTEPPEPTTPPPDQAVQLPDHSNDSPFRASLDGFDRHSIVHLSSNFRLVDGKNPKAWYKPQPLDVDLLALSSLGAWIDSRGAWDFPQPRGLSIEEWRHRATLGRDHYVRVVYAGAALSLEKARLADDLYGRRQAVHRRGRQRRHLLGRVPPHSSCQTPLRAGNGRDWPTVLSGAASR
jgi:hypothetical protein